MPHPNPHQFPITVYLEDTDAGGIVYHANYLKFAERARSEFLCDLGVEHADLMTQQQIMFVVKHCAIEYCMPARLGDKLRVESQIEEISGASLVTQQIVWRGEDKIVELKVKLACISMNGNIQRIPKFIVDILVNNETE